MLFFMYNYKKLRFYERAEILSDVVHGLTKKFPKFEIYELGGQMRRAVDSIVFNIAEGGGKESVRDMVSYLRHALGSVNEVESQIKRIVSLGYIEEAEGLRIADEVGEIGKMINGFIRKLREGD